MFSGFGPERREARAKSSSAACGGYSENFLALRSAKPRRYRPPTAAPGTARGPAKQVQIPPSPPEKAPHICAGLFTLFAGIWTRAPKGAGKKSDRRLRRMQGGFFGAAVGKAKAAAPADGRAGHRKRGRAFRPGRTALEAFETEFASLHAAAAGAARIFWRSGRQGQGGCARRRPRRAPQEGPRFPSRPHCPGSI